MQFKRMCIVFSSFLHLSQNCATFFSFFLSTPISEWNATKQSCDGRPCHEDDERRHAPTRIWVKEGVLKWNWKGHIVVVFFNKTETPIKATATSLTFHKNPHESGLITPRKTSTNAQQRACIHIYIPARNLFQEARLHSFSNLKICSVDITVGLFLTLKKVVQSHNIF